MIPKISAKIGILRSLRRIVPTDTLKQLYNAIVLPHFDYGDIIYDTASVTLKDRLQRLQSRAARLITGTGPRDSRNMIFKELGWISLQQRRDFHKCVIMYKCLNGLAPSYLCNMFRSSNHTHETRNSSDLVPPKTRTAYYEKSFFISGTKQWNDLPQRVKACHSLSSFKSALYKHISATPPF